MGNLEFIGRYINLLFFEFLEGILIVNLICFWVCGFIFIFFLYCEEFKIWFMILLSWILLSVFLIFILFKIFLRFLIFFVRVCILLSFLWISFRCFDISLKDCESFVFNVFCSWLLIVFCIFLSLLFIFFWILLSFFWFDDVKFIIWLDMFENFVIKMLLNEFIIFCVLFLFWENCCDMEFWICLSFFLIFKSLFCVLEEFILFLSFMSSNKFDMIRMIIIISKIIFNFYYFCFRKEF